MAKLAIVEGKIRQLVSEFVLKYVLVNENSPTSWRDLGYILIVTKCKNSPTQFQFQFGLFSISPLRGTGDLQKLSYIDIIYIIWQNEHQKQKRTNSKEESKVKID